MHSAKSNERHVMNNHPCFSEAAHKVGGRIHLPVAPDCNVQCGYCVRKFDCVNESRPGVASVILSPQEAIERVEAVIERTGDIAAIGIAGPGDPLANEATFETLGLIRRYYPGKIGCVSTNGLALPDRVGDLVSAGVRSITVTINAVMPETAAEIYLWITGPDGEKLRGLEAGRYLLDRQWDGLRMAVEAGLVVKVNTVLIPGVNELEIPDDRPPRRRVRRPQAQHPAAHPSEQVQGATPPTPAQIHEARAAAGEYLSQMTHCKQCRADACGIIGQDRDMETETLMARLGDVYEDSIF